MDSADLIYSPAEDSEFILEFIKKFAKGRVLDIGCGSGILSFEAAKYCDFVVGCDLSMEAVIYCRKKSEDLHNALHNTKFIVSDLFSNINEKFDLIIFNPPYLPKQKGEDNKTAGMVCGGKYGHELIEKFLSQAKNFLNNNGKILLLFSSLTGKEKVESIMSRNNFKFKVLAEKKLFFETLWVYLLEQG